MTHEFDSPIVQEDLIAYLDGEVDPVTRQTIEHCLANDPQLVQRMRQHQQAWDLLDELEREEVSSNFAQTTLQMVAVAAANDAEEKATKVGKNRVWVWLATCTSLMTASCVGYLATAALLDQPNRKLLQDLPVIENLEALQQVENVDFLRALENEGLFVAAEIDHEH